LQTKEAHHAYEEQEGNDERLFPHEGQEEARYGSSPQGQEARNEIAGRNEEEVWVNEEAQQLKEIRN